MILIYLILIQQIYSVHSSKVNVINMSDWTMNRDTKETKHLSEKQDLTQCYLVLCWPHKSFRRCCHILALHHSYRPDLFLGPVCPYVLSPVSRFSSIWSIPVFTTGGMNAAFRQKTSEYSLLTCLGGNYQQFGTFFQHLLDQYSWHHVMFLYNAHSAESGRGMSMCEFTLGQTFSMLGGLKNENISHIPFDAEKSDRST
jgi:hypothetical protein